MFEKEFIIIFVFGIFVSFFNIQYVKDIGTYEDEMLAIDDLDIMNEGEELDNYRRYG